MKSGGTNVWKEFRGTSSKHSTNVYLGVNAMYTRAQDTFLSVIYRLMKYHESIQANLLVSPRRCRRGFHLLEDEAANFPLSEDLEISHPEITFDTFFKRVTGPNKEVPNHQSKSDGTIFQVTICRGLN